MPVEHHATVTAEREKCCDVLVGATDQHPACVCMDLQVNRCKLTRCGPEVDRLSRQGQQFGAVLEPIKTFERGSSFRNFNGLAEIGRILDDVDLRRDLLLPRPG